MRITIKDIIGICILASLFFYFLAFGAFLINGVSDANYHYRDCNKQKKRLEYVLPAYRIGCWLGKVP